MLRPGRSRGCAVYPLHAFTWRRISVPMVPCPAIVYGSSYGATKTRPSRAARSCATGCNMRRVRPQHSHSKVAVSFDIPTLPILSTHLPLCTTRRHAGRETPFAVHNSCLNVLQFQSTTPTPASRMTPRQTQAARGPCLGVRLRLRVAVADELDGAAQPPHRLHLDVRRRRRHADHRVAALPSTNLDLKVDVGCSSTQQPGKQPSLVRQTCTVVCLCQCNTSRRVFQTAAQVA